MIMHNIILNQEQNNVYYPRRTVYRIPHNYAYLLENVVKNAFDFGLSDLRKDNRILIPIILKHI